MLRIKTFIIFILVKSSLAFEDCGVSKIGHGLSVGANYSEPGQWPWLASLFVSETFFCGSSIISKKHLLSAAHCVQPKGYEHPFAVEDFHALVGGYDLRNDTDALKVNFSQIFLHPEWNPSKRSPKYDADISIFEMTSEIEYTNLIQPICLPSEDKIFHGLDGIVVGYGLSESSMIENRPKHVELKSVNDSVCLYTDLKFAKVGSTRMFCAGERGKNPCRGDSGGPFMINPDRQWTIDGIVSVSIKENCLESDYVIFTKVSLFMGWIKEKVYKEKEEDLTLECEHDPIPKFPILPSSTTCINENSNLKILKPNLRVKAVKLSESLKYEEIRGIWIKWAQVHFFPDFSIVNEKFPNFKVLYIRDSGLKELDRSKLALLPQLTKLDVEENEIKELPEDIFDDLINLEELSIGFNQVKILPPKLFSKLPNLKYFIASSNKIVAIPAKLFEMNKNLEIIWLWNNKISQIEIDLKQLPKLNKFALSRNQCMDETFGAPGFYDKDVFQKMIEEKCGISLNCLVRTSPHNHLFEVCKDNSLKIFEPNLRVTSIAELPETSNFNKIDSLWIEKAEVHYLPDLSIAKEKFPNFEKLTIYNSGLKELDRSRLAPLPQLTYFSVEQNEIKAISEDIFDDLINLEWLNIGNNQLKILPQKLLWNLPKLKAFDARSNQIEAIPARFFEMNKNLDSIDFQDNEIFRIETDFKMLPRLINIFLLSNKCINKQYQRGLDRIDDFQRIVERKCS